MSVNITISDLKDLANKMEDTFERMPLVNHVRVPVWAGDMGVVYIWITRSDLADTPPPKYL
jgi:hypothetical protein